MNATMTTLTPTIPLALPSRPTSGPSATVWVVDADSSSRQELAQLARQIGYEAIEFHSAVALAGQYCDGPGCIVLACRHPAEPVADVLETLKRRGGDVPLIVVLDDCSAAAAIRQMRAGAFTVIPAATTSAVVEDAIREALEEDVRRRQADEPRQAARRRLALLSRQEFEVLQRVVAGDPNKAIARKLGVSLRTVEVWRSRIYDKLGVESVAEAVAVACCAEDERLSTFPPPSWGTTEPPVEEEIA